MRKINLIIPAAGSGTRMGLTIPKTLYKISGKPILEHILEEVIEIVDEAVIITSESGDISIRDFILSMNYKCKTAVQKYPIGMADAVEIGVRSFNFEKSCDYLVIWGDHVSVRRMTIQKVINEHQKSGAWLTFPTSIKKSPYTHVIRNENGNVSGILEAREGDVMPPEGENDCGIFLLKGEMIIQGLDELRVKTWDSKNLKFNRLNGRLSHNGEFNFLSIINLWASKSILLKALPIASQDETQGINSLSDTQKFNKFKQ
jgi:bifunctional UDP-N-acetylglucosamine pyrophosphorylase / glucosamine-1-phosphate N-acetyltransferase